MRHARRAAAAHRAVVLLAVPAQAADNGSFRDRAVAWAEQQAGVRERGTSDCSRVIAGWQRDMGLRPPPCRPWCGALAHQAFLRAGVRLSARMIDPHRSYADAVAGRRGLRRIAVSQVRRGDLVFFLFRRGVKASHVAIAREAPRDGAIKTIEGNVAHVARLQTRGERHVVLAARVMP